MSKQLALSAAASTLALAALALLGPGSARLAELPERMGATIAIAAPLSSAQVRALQVSILHGAQVLSVLD
jgi:hypothetical protein